MYVDDMMQILGLRLEDADNIRFSNSFKRSILELSQIKLSNILDNSYLTELEYLDSDKTATAKVLAFSSLTYPVLKGREGILKVKIHDGKYCTQVDINDLKRTENSYLEGTDDNPLFYVFQNNIYIACTTTSPHVDVYYLKHPSPLLYPLKYTKIAGKAVPSVADDTGIAVFSCVGHDLVTGDIITHTGFEVRPSYGSDAAPQTGVVTGIDADNYYLFVDGVVIGYDTSTDAGVFTRLNTVILQDSQNVSAVNDHYNGALFYNISKDSYHVASDYVGATRELDFYPSLSAEAINDETIYLLKHNTNAVEITNLESLEPDINVSLHELLIDLAEAECWKSGKKEANIERMAVIIGDVFKQISSLNERVKVQ